MNSRTKGKRGELEAAQLLREHGFDARRGQQFHGGGDSPDVVSEKLAGFHVEVKRRENGNPYAWVVQAEGDAAEGKVPLVLHRRNGMQWLAIMNAADLLDLIRERDDLRTDLEATQIELHDAQETNS
jgi:Holliday junction resolvase